MRRRRISGRTSRRALACVLGTLLVVGVSASPAWATAPDPPPQPTVVAGNAQIAVTFSAPAHSGSSPIIRYEATCASSNGGTLEFNNNDGLVEPIIVGGLTNGRIYTCSVTATNSEDTSTPSLDSAAVVPSTIPDAPPQPSVTPGNAQISVSFSPPASDGGNTIFSYTTTCTSTNGGAPGVSTGAGSPLVVTGLNNGKAYSCTIHATNARGSGSESFPSATTVPVWVPQAPDAPAVAPGNMQIHVSFVAPFDNGSPITSYFVGCVSSDGGDPGEMFGTNSPLIVSGLTNGRTYTCDVTATNAVGTGTTSAESVATTPALVPDPPAQPTVVPGNARITVTFGPSPADNGHPITGYTAACASSNGGVPRAHFAAGSPITVTALTNAKSYTCTVSASNLLGPGPPSIASVATIPATVPAAPSLVVAGSGNGSLHVSFKPGSDNGRPILGFIVNCTSSNGGNPAFQQGASSPLTVSGVANGQIYTCVVRARNVIGTSGASLPSRPVIVGQPSAPTITSVVSGPAFGPVGTLRVSFIPGSANAAAITSFRATCLPSAPGTVRSTVGAGSPLTVPSVLSGRAYFCVATATNSIGTSAPSASVRAVVGTPGPPRPSAPLALAHGLALPFSAAAGNGVAITGYRAVCASTNGGVAGSRLQLPSPIVVGNLTVGKTYVCVITAINSRGEGPPVRVGPVVVGAPNTPNLAQCTGHVGSLRAAPGLLLASPTAQTLTLSATMGVCTGPYVRSAQITFSFRSPAAMSCANAISMHSGGTGTITWPAPAGMGTSAASLQLVVTSTNGHTTTAGFTGLVTSQANVFFDGVISGTVTMQKGIGAVSSGGDCSPTARLQTLTITTVTMTLV